MLGVTTEAIAAIVRRVATPAAPSGGDAEFTLSGQTLTAIYRIRMLTGWLKMDVDATLDLVDLTAFDLSWGKCTPAALYDFVRTADWVVEAGLAPPDLRFLVTPPDSDPLGQFQQKIDRELRDGLPTLLQDIDRGLSRWRVKPTSFISETVDAADSARLYADLAAEPCRYLDASGVVTSALLGRLPAAPFRFPSSRFPTLDAAISAASMPLPGQQPLPPC